MTLISFKLSLYSQYHLTIQHCDIMTMNHWLFLKMKVASYESRGNDQLFPVISRYL